MLSAKRLTTAISPAQPASLLLCLLLSSSLGCDSGRVERTTAVPFSSASPRVLKVNVQKATFSEQTIETVVFFGQFKAAKESSLSFARGGVVQKVHVNVGDVIAEGDMLAELDQQSISKSILTVEESLKQKISDQSKAAPAERPALAAQVKSLQDQLSQLQTELAKGKVQAPFAGIVVRSNVKADQAVAPGTESFVMIDEQSPFVQLNLDSASADRIKSNQKLWVGHNGEAMVTSILRRSPLKGPVAGQQILLEFDFPLASEEWSYGHVVEVRFRDFVPDSGFWLPISSVQQSAGQTWSILTAKPIDASKRFVVERRPCRVIRCENDRVLVQSDALAEELVIVDGSHRVVAGQQVEPVEVSLGTAQNDSLRRSR